jgi:hypothetical protein
VRAAIYDELAGTLLSPWQPYGGASARAPVVTASPGGFVIAADDPAPMRPPLAEPCAEACDCPASASPDLVTGGLWAYRPGLDRPAERITPGRGIDGTYRPREAIAAIEAGGRAVIASSQAPHRSAELFEPVLGGWLRRHVSSAPVPTWLGALGDTDHLVWLGTEPDVEVPTEQHLVAGAVLIDLAEQRGELMALDLGSVLQVAPVAAANAVTTVYLLRGVSPSGSEPWARFEVLQVHADW